MFNFTPLLGVQSSSPASQSLLELDGGVKILIDVGWESTFDAQKLLGIEKHVSTLSVILLTHAITERLGAYAHCCKHIPLFTKIPVYATTPVINLGRTLLTDLYASSPLAASVVPASSIGLPATSSLSDGSPNFLLEAPTPDEIASYFALINPLKYSQPHQPIGAPWSPSLGGLQVTAYGAGHTLGGTVWHIQHGMESIVYAADWNQGRENLFPGAALLTGGSEVIEQLHRPTALVCSSRGAEVERPSISQRDEQLLSLIRETIGQGGKVLIPTDSSSRVLELAFLLNKTWREAMIGPHADTYRNARIYMASRSISTSVRYLQSMLEWMDDAVRAQAEATMTDQHKRGGDGKGANPLEWKHVKQVERKSQLERALGRSKPLVMLASDASLEWGFARQAAEALAGDSRNLVILTEDVSSGAGLGKQLLDAWRNQQGQTSSASGAKIVNTNGMTIALREPTTESLDPDETALYETYSARQQQLHSTLQGDNTLNDPSAPDLAEQEAEESSESEDEDEDAEHQGRSLNLTAQLTQANKRKAATAALTDAELGVNVLLRGKSVYDYDVRNKRGREKMFPFVAHRHRDDDFGELIRPEEYLRAEEKDDTNGVGLIEGAKQDGAAPGQKRKWDEGALGGGQRGKKGERERGGKKVKVEKGKDKANEPDDIDATIARLTGQTVPGDGANGVAAAAANDEESEESEDSDYEPESAEPAGPRKVVFASKAVEVRMRVAKVDFSGLHDIRALSMIIGLMRPRKLILTYGSESEIHTLAQQSRKLLNEGSDPSNTEIFTPAIGERVDASVDTNAWTLKLSRQLVKKLVWQDVKGMGVVALTGLLAAQPLEDEPSKEDEQMDEQSPNKRQKLSKPEDDAESKSSKPTTPALPVLDLPSTTPSNLTTHQPQQRVTQPVHVGDIKLPDLRALLTASGHQVRVLPGAILVDSTVIARKLPSGKVVVESAVRGLERPQLRTADGDGSFFAVRKAVYRGLAVVAGV